MTDVISLRGARLHNLRDLDLELPRGALIVLTGPSGSGKSSLAFGTLHAESQRRLAEATAGALPVGARPPHDALHGLTPTVALAQTPARGRLPNVLAAAGLADVVAVLWTRAGRVHCPSCDAEVAPATPARIADVLCALPDGAKVTLTAPVAAPDAPAREALVARGFGRVQLGPDLVRLDDPASSPRHLPAVLDVVVDRLIVRDGLRARALDSIETALRLGEGRCGVLVAPEAAPRRFSTHWRCPACDTLAAPLTPERFLGTSRGGCSTCAPRPPDTDPDADAPPALATACADCDGTRLSPLARAARLGGVSAQALLATPVARLPALLDAIAPRPHEARIARDGLLELHRRVGRLNALGLGHLTLGRPIPGPSAGELQRLRLVACLGAELSGLTWILDEPTASLHPDDVEAFLPALRRLRAADAPETSRFKSETECFNPETERLPSAPRAASSATVIVVSHSLAVMAAADLVVDLGPGAGPDGGRLVAQASPAALATSANSVSGPWLARHLAPPVAPPASPRRRPAPRPAAIALTLRGGRVANLGDLRLAIPAGAITALVGVSGAGKTALLRDVLGAHLRAVTARRPSPVAAALADVDVNPRAVTRLLAVDPTPLGPYPRSTLATWSGLFDEIRRLFAATAEARAAGFSASRFSFNAAGGRCEDCRGEGTQRLDMGSLGDLALPCDTCGGARYNEATLAIRWRGLSAADVLALSVAEARGVFAPIPAIARPLEHLDAVGLGYMRLGQPGSAISGGEAQRLRIAIDLARPDPSPAAVLVDEPSRGLHPVDIVRLQGLLVRLRDAGHTVIIAEHAPQLIAACDHIIELGPGAGPEGGLLVAEGSPAELARAHGSRIGRHLLPWLGVVEGAAA